MLRWSIAYLRTSLTASWPPLRTMLKYIALASIIFGTMLGRCLVTSTTLTFTTTFATEPVHRWIIRIQIKLILIPALSIFTTTLSTPPRASCSGDDYAPPAQVCVNPFHSPATVCQRSTPGRENSITTLLSLAESPGGLKLDGPYLVQWLPTAKQHMKCITTSLM